MMKMLLWYRHSIHLCIYIQSCQQYIYTPTCMVYPIWHFEVFQFFLKVLIFNTFTIIIRDTGVHSSVVIKHYHI